jgi:hypothetical protein
MFSFFSIDFSLFHTLVTAKQQVDIFQLFFSRKKNETIGQKMKTTEVKRKEGKRWKNEL